MKRVPIVSQFLKTECGLCCAAMISRYYGRYVSLEELREYQQVGRDGISGKQLHALLQWLGFDCKIYRCKPEHLSAIPLPAIAFWENSHYVVIERLKKDRVYVVDSGSGREIVSLEEFEQLFSGLMFCPKPGEHFTTKKPGRSVWWDYTFLFLKNKYLILLTLLLSLLSYVISTVVPMMVQVIIDEPSSGSSLLLAVGLAALFGYGVTYAISSFLNVLIKSRIYRTFFAHCMKKLANSEFQYFLLRPLGGICYNLDCIDTLNDSYSVMMVNSLISAGAIVILSVYFAIRSFPLFLVFLFLLTTTFFVLKLSNNRVIRCNQSVISSKSRLKGKQIEFLNSVCELKASGVEDMFYSEWETAFYHSVKKNLQKNNSEALYSSLNAVFSLVLPLVILLAAFYMVSSNLMTMGTAVSLYSLSTIITSFAMNFFSSINSVRTMENLTDRIKDLISQPTEKSGPKKIDDISRIQLDHVSFRYDKHSPLVLKDISLSIEKGQKIAIVGGSGSGKSTIAKLLIKMYEPTEGAIQYDGTPAEELDNKALRRVIGSVSQGGKLVNASIFKNVALLANKFTPEDFADACKKAQIYDDIVKLPMKAETLVSESGSDISGGQKQRIILARILMADPKILLLDEATSALDSVTEHTIFEELNKLKKTLIVIAHRLSTVVDADCIYVLKDGCLVEQGTYDELMEKRGEFYALYQCGLKEGG
ncbi:MAG: peptidase domain-containing ABC transporter [Oscillospiraceae bacterium]|nr:peptidase domain-containing ABC transporter [Oscillospiraceae bacterium]